VYIVVLGLVEALRVVVAAAMMIPAKSAFCRSFADDCTTCGTVPMSFPRAVLPPSAKDFLLHDLLPSGPTPGTPGRVASNFQNASAF
jgi:hypothetical protein